MFVVGLNGFLCLLDSWLLSSVEDFILISFLFFFNSSIYLVLQDILSKLQGRGLVPVRTYHSGWLDAEISSWPWIRRVLHPSEFWLREISIIMAVSGQHSCRSTHITSLCIHVFTEIWLIIEIGMDTFIFSDNISDSCADSFLISTWHKVESSEKNLNWENVSIVLAHRQDFR